MAERKFLYMDSEGFSTPQDVGDTITLGGLTITPGDISMSGTGKVTGLADGTNANDAVNKGQLDAAIISGGVVKELLLHEDQLDDTDGFNAAMALYMANNPVSGDLVIITDGTTTRSYGAASGGDVQFTIGATPADTMQNLATAIEGDGSAAWGAKFTTALESINSAGVVVLIEDASAAGASSSRVYTTNYGTPADCQLIEYAEGTGPTVDSDYQSSAGTAITSDPGYGRFGLRRQQSALAANEIHHTRNDDAQYIWDDDDDTWQVMNGPSSIPDATSASGGGIKGKITVDSDYGLEVASGILTIDLATDPGLEFSGGDLKAKADATAGIEITSGGIAIDLAASNPGVGFDGSGDLEAKASDGITKDANGIKADIDTGAGLKFDATASPDKKVQVALESDGGIQFDGSNGGLEIKIVSTDRLSVGASGLDVVGLPSLFEINGVAVSANVTAANLTELTGGGTTTLHSHAGADAAQRIENSITAAENLTAGDPVYYSTTDQVGKADADKATPAKAKVIGVCKTTTTTSNPAPIVGNGHEVAGVGTSWTVGGIVYLATGGGLTQTRPSGGDYVIMVGIAATSTDLYVLVQYMGKAP